MKRIFSFILAIMLSCSIALAEIGDSREMTSDEQAYNIYLDIISFLICALLELFFIWWGFCVPFTLHLYYTSAEP